MDYNDIFSIILTFQIALSNLLAVFNHSFDFKGLHFISGFLLFFLVYDLYTHAKKKKEY